MNIYEAIGSIMKKGVAIGKDNYNQQQKFKYRGIDDVMNVFQPLMSEAGIFMVPEVLDAKREERLGRSGGNLIYSIMKVKYTFYAEDGSSVSATVIGEGMDSGDKASNKAMAVAMKYAMFQTFCIPTEEMPDPDAETPEPSKPVGLPPIPQNPQSPPPPLRRQEPAPQNPQPTTYFTCARCGKKLLPYTDSDGRPVSLRAHAEKSMQRFGEVLCLDCIQNKA